MERQTESEKKEQLDYRSIQEKYDKALEVVFRDLNTSLKEHAQDTLSLIMWPDDEIAKLAFKVWERRIEIMDRADNNLSYRGDDKLEWKDSAVMNSKEPNMIWDFLKALQKIRDEDRRKDEKRIECNSYEQMMKLLYQNLAGKW